MRTSRSWSSDGGRVGILLILLAMLATACGGGSSGSETPATDEPSSSAAATESETEALSGEPVRVGVLLPQTGDAATTGRFMTDGYVAGLKELNDTGGIGGRPIEWEVFDTVGDPQNGLNAFNRFLAGGYSYALIGFSAVVTAVAPVSEKEDVLLVNSGAPPFNPDAMGSRTIHTLNGQDREMQCAAQYAYEDMGARNAGFMYADIAANFEGVKKFAAAFEELGGQVAGFEGAEQGSSDFRSSLTRLKQENPDLIYIYTFGADPGNILKQMDELGMDAMKMGYSGAAVPQTVEVGGSSAEGFVATAGVFDSSSDDRQTQAFLEARRKYVDPNDDPTKLGFYHATTYDGAKMLGEAMRYVVDHGGSLDDPSQVQQAFYDIGTFQAATGTAVYEEGNPVPRKPFQILQVTDGAFKPVTVMDC